jgi:chromosomal replication initiation ATPase DnaA
MVYLRKRAAELQVPVADIVGRSVEKKLTKIRRLLIAEIRENFGLSLREMGRLFGGRDQKAIAYAIQCHEAEQAIAR